MLLWQPLEPHGWYRQLGEHLITLCLESTSDKRLDLPVPAVTGRRISCLQFWQVKQLLYIKTWGLKNRGSSGCALARRQPEPPMLLKKGAYAMPSLSAIPWWHAWAHTPPNDNTHTPWDTELKPSHHQSAASLHPSTQYVLRHSWKVSVIFLSLQCFSDN